MTLMRVLGGSEAASYSLAFWLTQHWLKSPRLRLAILTRRNLAKFARRYYPVSKWLRAFLYLPFTIHHLPLFIVLDSDLTAPSFYHIPFIYLRQVKQVPYFLIPFHWFEPFHAISWEEGEFAEVEVPFVFVKSTLTKGKRWERILAQRAISSKNTGFFIVSLLGYLRMNGDLWKSISKKVTFSPVSRSEQVKSILGSP